ncbi:hypothetical protein JB92DRAFT_244106 [Gautieria morchelliformis]|nr:hypothetical protein JB92DRAFT_244106 [Gautieria morchelliformis]
MIFGFLFSVCASLFLYPRWHPAPALSLRRCLWLLSAYLRIATKYDQSLSYSLTLLMYTFSTGCPQSRACLRLQFSSLCLPLSSETRSTPSPYKVLMDIPVIGEMLVVSPPKPPVASPMKRKNVRDGPLTSPKKQMHV